MVLRHCLSSARKVTNGSLKTRIAAQRQNAGHVVKRSLSIAALSQPSPSALQPPQTRSRFGISRPPGWEPRRLAAPCSDEDVVAYLARLIPPLQFPQETALRMITHTSWRAGLEGNNNRFSFIGRRVLQAYTLAFLHAHTTLTPTPPLTQPPSNPAPNTQISHLPIPSAILEHDFDQITNNTVDTRTLGANVGSVWELERVMRWAPNRTGESVSNDAGLYKVRGTTVEAVVGGVFHQFGGVAAHRLFHTRILPRVAGILPHEYRSAALAASDRLGGASASLLVAQQAPPTRLATASG